MLYFLFILLYVGKKRSHTLTIYLIIVLALDIFSGLVSGGRTSFAMILFATGSAYFIFKDYWDPKLRRIISLVITIGGAFMLFVFLTLTFSRFYANNYSDSPMWSILSYLGQAPLNFNQYGLDAGGTRHGDRTMNYFKVLLGLNPPQDYYAVRKKYAYLKMDDSCFYTFVGDFTLDFGPIVALIIFVIFSLLVTRLIRTNQGKISFHKLLLVYFCACVCSQGSMYLFYYSFVQNFTMVAFLLMFIILWVDYGIHYKSRRCIFKKEAVRKRKKVKFRIKLSRMA